MNLAQIQAAVQAHGYDVSLANVQTVLINSAYRAICGMDRWPFLEATNSSITTTRGVEGYSLTAIPDLLHLDSVRIEVPGWSPGLASPEAYSLENMSPQEFQDLAHIDRDPATPHYWTQQSGQIRFWPTPDQVYTLQVDYIRLPPDLVNSTDTPLIPAVYHDIIVWSTVSELAFRERDWLGRNFADQIYHSRLKTMQEEYLLRQRQTSSHVKHSNYGRDVRKTNTAIQGW